MTPVIALGLFVTAVLAGVFGSMLGLGGGIILVPALTLIFGLGFHEAAAASLLGVVATSVAANAVYLRRRFTDVRLGLILELTTALGAIAGGFIAFAIPAFALAAIFAALLIYTAFSMWRDLRRPGAAVGEEEQPPAKGFFLQGSYFDPAVGRRITYYARHFDLGLLASTGAGMISGMLGVGGGIIKVPVMRLQMRVPLKVAAATSSYMIGITGATSVMLYFRQGYVDPMVSAVSALGILVGATVGPRLAARVHSHVLQYIFIVILIATAIQMVARAV